MVDTDALVELASTWWFEALGALIAVALGALALRAGDLTAALLGALALVTLVDRIRLRLDNRGLAEQIRRIRDQQAIDGD